MDKKRGSKKILSKFISAKTVSLALTFILSACASANKVTSIKDLKNEEDRSDSIEFKSDYLTNFNIIDLPGNNFISSVHKNGKRFLFFSGDRISHKKFQVYEYDLVKKRERRVTHQNGHAFHASYHPNNQHIIYASTTDFEKEDLSNLFTISENNTDKSWKSMLPSLKSDIFISRLNGTNIIRATFLDSSEQFPIYHPKDFTIVYKLSQDNNSSIEAMSRYRKPLKPISKRTGKHGLVDISKSGKKLAWINYDEDKGFFLISMNWKSKKKTVQNLPNILSISSLAWLSDNEFVITARSKDDDVHQLYYLKDDMSCFEKLAQTEFGVQNAISTTQNKLHLTAYTGTHWQLVESNVKTLPNCTQPKG